MDYVTKKLYQLCFIVCAVMIAALAIWILFNKVILKNDLFDRKYSPTKKRAMYPSPPKELLSNHPSEQTIGTYKRKYVNLPYLHSPLHQLVLGEPGAGKSSTIENGILYGENFADVNSATGYKSILCIDSKPESARKGVFEGRKDVKIVNPTSMHGSGFNVMYGISQNSSDDDLKVRCRQIAKALVPDQHGDDAYFSSSGQNLLTGFLMYGYRKGLSFIDSVNKAKSSAALDLIAEIMADPDMDAHPKIRSLVAMYEDDDSDGFASISTTLGKDLDVFEYDTVRRCFSENNSDVATPQDLINGASIFLTIPDTLVDEFSIVLGMVMEICIRYLMSQDEYSLQDEKPIWIIADEASTIYIPSLPSALARGRSKCLAITTAGQSVKAFQDRYGSNIFGGMMECCSVKMIFSCSDPDTLRGFSELCGEYEEKKTSYTQQGISVATSSNTSTELRKCVTVSDIRGLPDRNELLVFYKGTWFIVKKRPYFLIPKYAKKSKELFEKNHEFERSLGA